MKKNYALLLLCLFFMALPACAGAQDARIEALAGRDYPPYSAIDYARLPLDAYAEAVLEMADAVRDQPSFNEVQGFIEQMLRMTDDFSTMAVYVELQIDLGREIEYWQAELDYLDSAVEALEEACFVMEDELYFSPWREDVIALYGADFFAYYDEPEAGDEDAQDALLDEEAALLDRYDALLEEATVRWGGSMLTLDDIAEIEDMDEFTEAYNRWCAENNPDFAEIMAALVRTRNAYARALGYADYTDYAFAALGKDYTPGMVMDMVRNIAEYIAPLALEAGLDDTVIPGVHIELDEYLPAFQGIAEDFDPSMAAALDALFGGGYAFTEDQEGKNEQPYVSYLQSLGMPFLFMRYAGDLDSMMTFAHEFGHFYEHFLLRDDRADLGDISETHSQSLEMVFTLYLQTFFDAETTSLLLYDATVLALDTLVQFSYDAACAIPLYALADEALTAENINALMGEASRNYLLDEYYEELPALEWISRDTLFHVPYDDLQYATSMGVALQVMRLHADGEGEAAREAYHALLLCDGTRDRLVETVEEAGLISPFEEECMRAIADSAFWMLEDAA